jgi:hypothetical protein
LGLRHFLTKPGAVSQHRQNSLDGLNTGKNEKLAFRMVMDIAAGPRFRACRDRGNRVAIVDNSVRREWEHEPGAQILTPSAAMPDSWFVSEFIQDFEPEAIVHFAGQRSR